MILAMLATSFVFSAFDTTLTIIGGFILVISVLKRIVKDRALALFKNSNVVVNMEDGSIMWGKMKLFPNAMELMYDKPLCDGDTAKYSYLFYDNEIDNFIAIFRCSYNLSKTEKKIRDKQIRRLTKRYKLIQVGRWLGNFVRRFRDAVRKVVSAFVGEVYKSKKIRKYNDTKEQVEDLGTTAVDVLNDNLYEPILEQYIGEKVVVELIIPNHDNWKMDIVGYLADYSEKFLCLMNIESCWEDEEKISLPNDGANIENEKYSIAYKEKWILFTNNSRNNLMLDRIRKDETCTKLLLLPGAFVKLQKGNKMDLYIYKIRFLDIILPRDHAKVRHATFM
jgi:hypothetical protein